MHVELALVILVPTFNREGGVGGRARGIVEMLKFLVPQYGAITTQPRIFETGVIL